MKFRFTFLFFLLSSLMFIGEVVLDCDLIKFINMVHSVMVDRCVSVVIFGVTGLVIDYIIHIKQKKERGEGGCI